MGHLYAISMSSDCQTVANCLWTRTAAIPANKSRPIVAIHHQIACQSTSNTQPDWRCLISTKRRVCTNQACGICASSAITSDAKRMVGGMYTFNAQFPMAHARYCRSSMPTMLESTKIMWHMLPHGGGRRLQYVPRIELVCCCLLPAACCCCSCCCCSWLAAVAICSAGAPRDTLWCVALGGANR
jgi:hypothetical protein